MIRLSIRDSSILARIAQYDTLDKSHRERLLTDLESPPAREIGRILIDGDSPTATPEERAFASELKSWAGRNRAYAVGREKAAAG